MFPVGSVSIILESSLGPVDFYPSGGMAVIYLPEADLLDGEKCAERFLRLQKVSLHHVCTFDASMLPFSFHCVHVC